jgi:hypothetical protein
MTNCLYYTSHTGDSACYCKHPDKPHHMMEPKCPLYRPDWSKATNQVDDLRKRFGIPGKK